MQPARAIEVTEPGGAAHGYPAWCDIEGKKLGDGEFRQWVENDRLHVVITYKCPDGQLYEEAALFRQHPEFGGLAASKSAPVTPLMGRIDNRSGETLYSPTRPDTDS